MCVGGGGEWSLMEWRAELAGFGGQGPEDLK